jgi:glucokinase
MGARPAAESSAPEPWQGRARSASNAAVILAGDIGGTNARLSLLNAGSAKPERTAVYESRKYPSLEAVLREFLGVKPPAITAATFGIAGPVVKNRCVATNLPWTIDGKSLARRLPLGHVTLINDLVALGLGALTVPRSKLVALNGGTLPARSGANVAVIAAGTGLGEAQLLWADDRFLANGTEGGHSDFAARDAVEDELLRFLRTRFGHVSYERVLSGPGLGNLYDFFRDARGVKETARIEAAIASAPDRNAAIAAHGVKKTSKPAAQAVALFASLYGAEAGNLALKTMAMGGVFVAGNIAAALLPLLQQRFAKAFVDKGRFRPLLEQIPVAVVLDTHVGLRGSAWHAARAGF